MNRRNLFTGTIAAIAALTVGKAQAGAVPEPTLGELRYEHFGGSEIFTLEEAERTRGIFTEEEWRIYWGFSQALT